MKTLVSVRAAVRTVDMARTKQKVREEWAERKAGGGAATSENADAEAEVPNDDGEEQEEEDQEYEIDEIVAKRIGGRKKVEFEVKWKGFEETTWEPLANIEDTAAYEEWLKHVDDDGEDEGGSNLEGESDGDESSEPLRGGKRKRAQDDDDDSDESYKDSGDDDDEEDSDEEYVPEGRAMRGVGRSSSKHHKAKPLNDRQQRLLKEELDEASESSVRATLRDLVRDHPNVYADVRALLKKHGGAASEEDEDSS